MSKASEAARGTAWGAQTAGEVADAPDVGFACSRAGRACTRRRMLGALGAFALAAGLDVACGRPARAGDVAEAAAEAEAGLGDAPADTPESAAPADEPPAWATFRDAWVYADVDADGAPEELELRGRRLRVRDNDVGEPEGPVLLETDAGWLVSDVLAADFDADGAVEVAFLLWRHGNYGSVRPFWEQVGGLASDGAAASDTLAEEPLTQHLFLYRWSAEDGRLNPAWMSSRLGVQVSSIELVETAASFGMGTGEAGDGRPRLHIVAADGRVTLWEWIQWGFALVEEGEKASDEPVGTGPEPAVSTSDGAVSPTNLSLLAVGDNIAHANVYEGAYDAATRSFDFSPCYEQVCDRIREYDVAVVCQETVLVANPARRSGYPRFATPQVMGDALAGAGFDVVLGATNHANDQGPQAIGETCAFWADEHPEVVLAGLHAEPVAAGRPGYVERNGIRLALFDYTYGLNGNALAPDDAYCVDVLTDGGEKRLVADVAAECARGSSDLVACFLHIGEEYDPEPTAAQKSLVVHLIDAGAAAVVCSHTHVRGPWGRVRTATGNEGAVFWGLGNFLSGQLDDEATAHGLAATLRVEKPAGSSDALGTASGTAPRARIAAFDALPLVCRANAAGLPQVAFGG